MQYCVEMAAQQHETVQDRGPGLSEVQHARTFEHLEVLQMLDERKWSWLLTCYAEEGVLRQGMLFVVWAWMKSVKRMPLSAQEPTV